MATPRGNKTSIRRLRALLLSADVGESHAQMAYVLAGQLKATAPIEQVTVRNDLSVLGQALGERLSRGFRVHLGQARWSYDAAYALFTRVRVARLLGERALYALGGGPLRATIERHRPDVIVSTYPVLNPVLGGLRAAGRCPCPVAAVVEPCGGLAFWVHPGLDLHMALYPEALPSIQRLAGDSTVQAVRPLVREEFFEPRSRAQARADLGLRRDGPLALVSGGGWGAGDLEGVVAACLRVPARPELNVVAIAGRNQRATGSLRERFAHDQRVTVLGFTEHMRDLMYAADVLITATAGLSCVEARLCGCPVVIHGFSVGHVRDNAAALVEHGLALAASDRDALPATVAAALRTDSEAVVPAAIAALPSAGELTVRLASNSDRATAARPGTGDLHKRPSAGVTQATWFSRP